MGVSPPRRSPACITIYNWTFFSHRHFLLFRRFSTQFSFLVHVHGSFHLQWKLLQWKLPPTLHGSKSTSTEAFTSFHGSKFTSMEISTEVNSTVFHGTKSASMEASTNLHGSSFTYINFHGSPFASMKVAMEAASFSSFIYFHESFHLLPSTSMEASTNNMGVRVRPACMQVAPVATVSTEATNYFHVPSCSSIEVESRPASMNVAPVEG